MPYPFNIGRFASTVEIQMLFTITLKIELTTCLKKNNFLTINSVQIAQTTVNLREKKNLFFKCINLKYLKKECAIAQCHADVGMDK